MFGPGILISVMQSGRTSFSSSFLIFWCAEKCMRWCMMVRVDGRLEGEWKQRTRNGICAAQKTRAGG